MKVMKKGFCFLVIILISQIAFNQEFSFSMYFEDAIGNKDTLILGYDNEATDTIDQLFGEINIINLPLDSLFDVRISNIFYGWHNWGPGTFQTKKQIVKKKCGYYFALNCIDFYCHNWPVTATWDKSLFNTDCLEGSVFTSCMPGGWFDVLGPSDLDYAIMVWDDSVTFTSNSADGFIEWGDYLNSNGELIQVFWQLFGDKSLINVDENKISLEKKLNIYPNPINHNDNLNILSSINMNNTVQIIDILGNSQIFKINNNMINIRNLEAGIYFLKLQTDRGNFFVEKIIIE
jgi:hypothetical protein